MNSNDTTLNTAGEKGVMKYEGKIKYVSISPNNYMGKMLITECWLLNEKNFPFMNFFLKFYTWI